MQRFALVGHFRSSSSRTFLALTVVGAVAVAGVGAVSTSRRPASPAVVVTISGEATGRLIPAGFAGLSVEYRGLAHYAGTDPLAVSPVFEQLLRNLAPGQRAVLRIGGDSADWTWWPARGIVRPGGIRFDLTKGMLGVAGALARKLGAQLILGLNLEANNPRLAAAEARAMIGAIGRSSIQAFEIGNEPELYGSFPWYHTPSGRHVKGRPPGYDFPAFTSDFTRFARALPRLPLAGPNSGAPNWLPQLPRFLAREPRIGLVTLHSYPLKHCTPSSVVTIPELLANASQGALADGLAPYVALAHAHRVPIRIDELNGVSCGGARGVSDTFAAALWSLDTLFEMARVGVDGVNFHTVPRYINDEFSTSVGNGHWQASVHPQYYGLMMFAQAAPPGSRLLKISRQRRTPVHVWATRGPDRRVRVVLINEGLKRSRVVNVRIPGAQGPGTLERLQAPHVGSKTGVSLGGQSFGSLTTTGLLAGAPSTISLALASGGYVVALPPASAALLTLAPR